MKSKPKKLKHLNKFRKLSDLLEVALKDLAAVERMKKTYKVDMGSWHEPKFGDDSRCAVCLAGSVMARTMQLPPSVSELVIDNSSQQGRADWWKLSSINEARVGELDDALTNFAAGEACRLKLQDDRTFAAIVPAMKVQWYVDLRRSEPHVSTSQLDKGNDLLDGGIIRPFHAIFRKMQLCS